MNYKKTILITIFSIFIIVNKSYTINDLFKENQPSLFVSEVIVDAVINDEIYIGESLKLNSIGNASFFSCLGADLSSTIVANSLASPLSDVTYFASNSDGHCNAIDSLTIQVNEEVPVESFTSDKYRDEDNCEYILVIGTFKNLQNAKIYTKQNPGSDFIKENDLYFVYNQRKNTIDSIEENNVTRRKNAWIKKIKRSLVPKNKNSLVLDNKNTFEKESALQKVKIDTNFNITNQKKKNLSNQYFLCKIGDYGPHVEEIQKFLQLNIDGFFGKETQVTVKEFQKKNNLNITGEVDIKTYLLIKVNFNKKNSENKNNLFNTQEVLEIGDQGEVIKKIQIKLNINSNGFFCKETQKSIIQYQSLHNLERNGKINKETYNHIFNNVTTFKQKLSTSLDGINFIKDHEGFSATSYRDIGGVWTIGYGSTSNMSYKQINEFDSISKDLAEEYLLFYINKICEPIIKKYVIININQNEFDALVSFIYNVGPSNFRNSTLLKKLNLGDREGAYDELVKWIRVNNRPNIGIYKRRMQEKELATTPVIYKIEKEIHNDSLKSKSITQENRNKFVTQCIIDDKCYSFPTNINPEESIIETIMGWWENYKNNKALFNEPPKYQIHYSDFRFYLSNFLDSTYINEIEWSNLQKKIIYKNNSYNQGNNKNRRIYAFHPFWMGNSYLNYPFHLIDRIGFYGYIIDPKDGSDLSSNANNIANGFSNNDLHKIASKNGVKVDLVVGSYDIKSNVEIFKATKRAAKIRCNAIYNIVDLVSKYGNGVCFDFQKIPVKYKQQYINMIFEISERLKSDTLKDYNISIIIPSYDVGIPHNLNANDYLILDKLVDRWIIQPSSSYNKTNEELEESKNLNQLWDVEVIQNKITKLPREIQNNLTYELDIVQSRLVEEDSSLKIMPYHQLMAFDSLSAFKLYEQTRNKLHLLQRIDAGDNIAVWSFGYDNSNEDITSLIEFYLSENDLRIDPKILNNLSEKNNLQNQEDLFDKNDKIDFIKSLDINKKINPFVEINKAKSINSNTLIILILSVIIFFIMLGFFAALFFEFSRERILQFNNIGYFILVLFLTSLIVYLNKIKIINNESFLVIGGIIIGLIISYPFISKRRRKIEEERP